MRRRKQRTMKVENGPTLFSTHNKALKRQSFLHTQIYRIRSFRRTSDIEDAGKADCSTQQRQTFKETQISRKAQFVKRLTASAKLAGRMRGSEEARPGRAPARPTLGGAIPKTGYHWPPGFRSGQSAWGQACRHHPLRARDA